MLAHLKMLRGGTSLTLGSIYMTSLNKILLLLIFSTFFTTFLFPQSIVKMKKHSGGTYEFPVEINGVLRINLIFDSGASEVSISPDVALTLLRTGTISDADWLPSKEFQFADGSTARSQRFVIRKLNIGGNFIYNVAASISNNLEAPLLLGQSALSKLGKIQIDYENDALIILSPPVEPVLASEKDPNRVDSFATNTTQRSASPIVDLFLGSYAAKQYLNGWLFQAGYQRTNFAHPANFGINQDYGEGFQFSMGYISLPFILRLDAFLENIATVADYSYGYQIGDRTLVHNGLNLSASIALLPSLKYGFPFVGLAQQVVIYRESTIETQIAPTSAFWLAGVQVNLSQFEWLNTLSGVVFLSEYKQSIGPDAKRRADLSLTIGLRMRAAE